MARLGPWSPERSMFSPHHAIHSPSTDPFGGSRTLVPDSDSSTSLRDRYRALAATEKLKDDLIKVGNISQAGDHSY